jgi:hypothetical protein
VDILHPYLMSDMELVGQLANGLSNKV